MTSQVSQVKEAIDLVALIGERVKLTRSGSSYKGVCPFHSEKSPSFFVNPQMQRYMCFGCHETGDCFTFLEKYDSMTFGESLQYLAKKAGIQLDAFTPTSEDAKRERLLAILSLAKEYYHYLLTQHAAGEDARKYLEERGIHQETITTFGIGYSLPSWDGLHKYLIGKKGFTETELLDAGLSIRSEKGRYYDRFRGRLMFPLTNPRGGVVGFSGRLLEKEAKEAKYINSPETQLYHKSELLFGYSQLQRFIREKEEVLVMEGEFDVLSSYQAHVKNVIAIKGSAISGHQVKLLSRSVKRILFSLDSDNAGKEATKRAIEIAKDFDLSLRVVPVAGGKDPDDIARENPAKWREMVKKSITVYDYLIDLAFTAHDPNSGEGKKEITNELAPLIASITNAVEQAHYVQTIAKKLGVREDVFLTEVRKKARNLPDTPMKKEEKPQEKQGREQLLLEYALSLVFHSEGQEFLKRVIPLEPYTSDMYAKMVEIAKQMGLSYNVTAYTRLLPEELKHAFFTLYMRDDEHIQSLDISKEFENALSELKKLEFKQQREATSKRISELEEKTELTPAEEQELRTLLSQISVPT
jgi:DNA primase